MKKRSEHTSFQNTESIDTQIKELSPKEHAYWSTLLALYQEKISQDSTSTFANPQESGATTLSRRELLQLLGASMALAGLNACIRRPKEVIVPYVREPENTIPGKPSFFATALTLGGVATGVLVESHLGRPTKIEGNSKHPASLGATDVFSQAAVLGLYDPDRSQVVKKQEIVSTWGEFFEDLQKQKQRWQSQQGKGLYILTEHFTSPTLHFQFQKLLASLPQAKWYCHDPIHLDSVKAATKLAFGSQLDAQYHFENADLVVSLDADFLSIGASSVRYARDFAKRRQPSSQHPMMNRMYVIESLFSITGAMADHRLALKPSELCHFARLLAAELGIKTPIQENLDFSNKRWVQILAQELKASPGRSLVIAGEFQPKELHLIAQEINRLLKNVGTTVMYTESIYPNPPYSNTSIQKLAQEMRTDQVDHLFILGGNPVYATPIDIQFSEALSHVPWRVHLGLYQDETAVLCDWHLPVTHELETWSDARAYDGTVTLMQPLIAPLYEGRSRHEVLAMIEGEFSPSGYKILRDYWQTQWQPPEFEYLWTQSLEVGFVLGTKTPIANISGVENPFILSQLAPPSQNHSINRVFPRDQKEHLELVFRPDPRLWDGSFANLAWLQELPKPITTLTWDNAVLLSPATAKHFGLETGNQAELLYRDRTLDAPVLVVPGQADGTAGLWLGHGRTNAGNVGSFVGVNAYSLQTNDAPWFGSGLTLRKIAGSYPLAFAQRHHSMEGRNLVHEIQIEALGRSEDRVPNRLHLRLFPELPFSGYQWGMVINLNSCIGCGTCTIACQAENNIPVVGKKQVLAERIMHWIRVDHYHQGFSEKSRVLHQPVPCMHCENAPCELVCPVEATLHDHEGLNVMVYNRCIGTRYCQNNCPYKVRRFNFFEYSQPKAPVLELLPNPDVTVRSRGVMEKCTYCIQRINSRRIQSQLEDRPVKDGDVVPACAQACPTEAIIFGDINDPKSRIAQARNQPGHYALLEELNTRPRTTYISRIRNSYRELSEMES